MLGGNKWVNINSNAITNADQRIGLDGLYLDVQSSNQLNINGTNYSGLLLTFSRNVNGSPALQIYTIPDGTTFKRFSWSGATTAWKEL